MNAETDTVLALRAEDCGLFKPIMNFQQPCDVCGCGVLAAPNLKPPRRLCLECGTAGNLPGAAELLAAIKSGSLGCPHGGQWLILVQWRRLAMGFVRLALPGQTYCAACTRAVNRQMLEAYLRILIPGMKSAQLVTGWIDEREARPMFAVRDPEPTLDVYRRARG